MIRTNSDHLKHPQQWFVHWTSRRTPAFIARRAPGAVCSQEIPAIDRVGPGQCRQKIKTTNLSQFFEHRDPKPCTVSSTIQPVRFEVKRIGTRVSGNLAGALAFRKRNSRPQLVVNEGAGFDDMGFCEPLNVAREALHQWSASSDGRQRIQIASAGRLMSPQFPSFVCRCFTHTLGLFPR